MSNSAPKQNYPAILLLSFSLLLCQDLQSATAKESSPGYQPDLEHYLAKLGTVHREGYLKEEVRKFRSYPRLDRAYRLQRERRLPEAAKEFAAYLALNPEDIRSRVSYLVLLDQMSLPNEVVAQADLILSRWPGFVPAYFSKGLAYLKRGDQARAFAAFSQAAAAKEIRKEDRIFALSTALDLAISLRDFDAAGRMLQALQEIERTQARQLKAGYLYEKTGQFDQALNAYLAAGNMASTPAEKVTASLALAEVAIKLNLREQARQAYLSAIESDSNNAAALRGLAQLAYRDNKYDEAGKWILQLERDGLSAEDREFLAQLYLNQQDYAAAIVQLKAALAQEGMKASKDTLTTLAQAYESAGKFPESAALYQSLQLKAPQDGELQLRLGNLLVRMEKFQAAEPHLRKALSSNLAAPGKHTAQRNLALIYEKAGNFQRAAEYLKLSLSNQPAPGADTLVRLAVLLNKGGKSAEAQSYLDRALAVPSLPYQHRRQAHLEKGAIFEKAGDHLAAAAQLEKSLQSGGPIDPETLVRLAILLHKGGKPEQALSYLDRALAAPSLTAKLKRVAWREKGLLLEQAGRPLEAAREYEKAVAAGERSPTIYLILANLYRESEPVKADSYLDQVIKSPVASTGDRCSAEDGLGLSYLQKQQSPEALAHFLAATRLCGESWQRRYYSGLARYQAKNWQQALEQFQLAELQKKDAANLLGMALCHVELGRPGAAVHYLESALGAPGSLKPEQLKQINDTLGFLYAEEHAYDKAAYAFARSLANAPDDVISLKLATVLNLADHTDRSWRALSRIEAGRLSQAERIEYKDLKAGVLQKQGKHGEALVLLEEAQKLQPTADRSYRMGGVHQTLGQRKKGIERFRYAYEKEPQHDEYALSLGYACLADKRFKEAIAPFEVVAARNPEFSRIREELGYLHSRIGDNEKALFWFKNALDSYPVLAQGNSKERESWEKDTHRLRSEIGKRTKSFGAALYSSYRAGNAPTPLVGTGQPQSGGLTGQTGLEAWYRPGKIGFIDDRIFEIFGRVFGNLDANSLKYNSRSTQAGIGLRYKFLKSENLWLSGEKLFKVGEDALDDWLLRLLYSRGKGFEPRPLELSQNYYLLYGELDAYLSSETVAAYAEVRKGRAFTVRPHYLLTPHLVLDSRWQSPYSAGGNYLEGGAALSLKYFFNRTRYHNYRDMVDFSITYKHGIFFDRGYGRKVGDYDTALFSVGVFFR